MNVKIEKVGMSKRGDSYVIVTRSSYSHLNIIF